MRKGDAGWARKERDGEAIWMLGVASQVLEL